MSNIEGEFRLLSDADFREISGQFLYIECKDILEKMTPTEDISPSATGLIVYAYIDHTSGLSCWPVLIAELNGDSLHIFNLSESNTRYIFRINEEYKENSEEIDGTILWMCHITPDHKFCNAELFGKLSGELRPLGDFIDRQYGMNNPNRKMFRDNREWDHIRNQFWPDDLQVRLIYENGDGEIVWVRTEFAAENEFVGELLNEPFRDLNIHKGDMVGFKEHVFDDGELILYSTFNVWREKNLS